MKLQRQVVRRARFAPERAVDIRTLAHTHTHIRAAVRARRSRTVAYRDVGYTGQSIVLATVE